MVYEGFLKLGGVEIVNSERVRGYARTSDCYLPWLQGPECETLQDALGDSPYDFDNMPLAPWHDSSMSDVSGRFLGAFGLSLSGLDSSTRSSQSTEGIMDGGTLGRTRKGMMSARMRATLLAKGRDALDYGVAWLNAAMDANRCGQHGGGCGTTDMEFLAECPPTRAIVREYTPWVEQRRNLFANPSFEAAGGTVEVQRNRYIPAGIGFGSIVGGATSTLIGPYSGGYLAVTPGEKISIKSFGAAGNRRQYGFSTEPPTVSGVPLIGLVNLGNGDGLEAIDVTVPAGVAYMAIYVSNEGTDTRVLAVSSTPDPFRWLFDGSTQPRVRENLAINPSSASSNNGSTHPVTPNSPAPPGNPDGFTTAFVQRNLSGNDNVLINTYNLGQTGNRPDEDRWAGAWVFIDSPQNDFFVVNAAGFDEQDIPSRQWVWVSSSTSNAGWMGLRVYRRGGPVSILDRGYVAGVTAERVPVVSSFDGDHGAPEGYATAWTGSVGGSTSFMYDADLTPSWVGTPDASESVLTGVGVAGVAANSTNLAVYQSSDSPAHGTKVARYLASTTSALALSPSTVAPDVAGKTYTILIRARSRDRLELATPRFGGVTAGVEGRKELPPGEWVEWRYTATSVTPSAVSLGLYVYQNPSRIRGEAIDVDAAVFVEGEYSGPYFDGNTPTQELAQYSWVGDENASQSIREIRQPIDRLQDDAEYAVDVDALRRFLHDVSVTSGPLPVEHYSFRNPEGYFGVTMEWTITSERAWIYSKTRSVELPVTPTMIVQDAPFNLVPHPSAELASGTVVVATNYIKNPSLESSDVGWSASGPPHTAAAITGGRSNELAASGTYSYRGRLLGNGAGGATNLSGQMDVRSEIADLSTMPGSPRPSFTVWAAGIVSGGQSGTTLESIKAEAEWWAVTQDGSGVMGYTTLNLESGGISGGVYTAPSTAPPAGANAVRFLITAKYKYSSSATAANNTDLRLYVDAAAVTVP